MARRDLAHRVFDLIGDPPLQLRDLEDGWPALGTLATPDGELDVALHVSQAGDYFRKPHEYRFQNPGGKQPVVGELGFPVLVGLADENTPVLIGVDGRSRVGREKRFSLLFNKNIIGEAASNGFSRYISSTGEAIYAFPPALFPTFMEIALSELGVDTVEVAKFAKESGFLEDGTAAAAERARRATRVLVRHHAFGSRVKTAYNEQGSMCGIAANLVVGAHIYPASAPESPDAAWNGLALCQNHHTAFDNHDIWVHPDNYEIRINPQLVQQAEHSPALASFIETTFERLMVPDQPMARPRPAMFLRRYEYFEESYSWVHE